MTPGETPARPSVVTSKPTHERHYNRYLVGTASLMTVLFTIIMGYYVFSFYQGKADLVSNLYNFGALNQNQAVKALVRGLINDDIFERKENEKVLDSIAPNWENSEATKAAVSSILKRLTKGKERHLLTCG